MAEQKPAADKPSEEELALEELLAAENLDEDRTADEAASVAGEKGAADPEMAALEDLVAAGSAPAETQPAAKAPGQAGPEAGGVTKETPSNQAQADEELAALEDLVAAQEQSSPGPEPPDETEEKTADDGIITLKEVVSLGGADAKADVVPEKEPPDDEASAESLAPESPDEDLGIAGLSAEEHNDLDKLIKGLREEKHSGGSSQADLAALQKQVRAMKKRVIELTRVVAECDKRMRSYSEIMRLFFQKSEVMNKRIDAIAESKKGRPKA